jgi:hypothetical protein
LRPTAAVDGGVVDGDEQIAILAGLGVPEADGMADFVDDGAEGAVVGKVDELASADAADVRGAGKAVAAAELDVVGFGGAGDEAQGGVGVPGADGGFDAGGDFGNVVINDVGHDAVGPPEALAEDEAGGARVFALNV